MTIDEIITALETATGPSRELDAEIAVVINGGEIVWKQTRYTMEQYPARRYASAQHVGGYGFDHVPEYTASLGAALTLARTQIEVGNMLSEAAHWAFITVPGDDSKPDPWPCIKAMLGVALKARKK